MGQDQALKARLLVKSGFFFKKAWFNFFKNLSKNPVSLAEENKNQW